MENLPRESAGGGGRGEIVLVLGPALGAELAEARLEKNPPTPQKIEQGEYPYENRS